MEGSEGGEVVWSLEGQLRSLDFILGAVRTLEGFLEGDDVSRLYLRKMALVLCRGRLDAGRPVWRLSRKVTVQR